MKLDIENSIARLGYNTEDKKTHTLLTERLNSQGVAYTSSGFNMIYRYEKHLTDNSYDLFIKELIPYVTDWVWINTIRVPLAVIVSEDELLIEGDISEYIGTVLMMWELNK